ncbi:MAG: nitrate reductase [Defluviitaleaceae bacterium]|nr:nitrate reductase [Defluviitaleaceae bacterium]
MKRIMINADNCKGCKNCSIACMRAHGSNSHETFYNLGLTDPVNESRNIILIDSQGKPKPLFCRHCNLPECATACMSGAMTKDSESGYVRYNAEKCGACFMCVMNCPYGVLKPDKATKSRVVKCDFCAQDGDAPNCCKVCPSGTIYVEEV